MITQPGPIQHREYGLIDPVTLRQTRPDLWARVESGELQMRDAIGVMKRQRRAAKFGK